MAALLGYVVDIVVGAVMEIAVIDTPMKSRVIRALNKVVWMQNDLFARHYIPTEGYEKGTPPPKNKHQSVVEVQQTCTFSS